MDLAAYVRSIEWTPKMIVKVAILFVAILFVASFIASALRTLGAGPITLSGKDMTMHGYDGYAEQTSYGYAVDEAIAPSLSVRNVASIYPQPYPGGTIGEEAEAYEVTQYSVTVKSGNAERDCAAIRDLKARDTVVFESANEPERGCSFTFKVAKTDVDEIIAFLEAFDPDDLSEDVYTIAQQIRDFTSEEEILQKKLATVTETLETATDAYDDITTLAIRTQDAQALARVIESKLQIVERLTQERINVSAQLDRLARSKAEQLDRLEYTYFYVSVYESKIVDGESLAEAWRAAAQATIHDVNRILTETTLGVIALIFLIMQWLVYGAVLVAVVMLLWRVAKRFW